MSAPLCNGVVDFFGLVLTQWIGLIIPGVAYLLFVALLRQQRARTLPTRFGLTDRKSFSRMTVDQAQAILRDLTELEFPKFMGFSIIFTIFKVCIVPFFPVIRVATSLRA